MVQIIFNITKGASTKAGIVSKEVDFVRCIVEVSTVFNVSTTYSRLTSLYVVVYSTRGALVGEYLLYGSDTAPPVFDDTYP